MSTIKVNALRHTGASSDNISLDSSGNVSAAGNLTVTGSATLNGLAYPSAGPLSSRNLIVNGAMQVSQRGTSFTVTTGNPYTLDRFVVQNGGGFNFNSTLTQSSTAPAGFASSLKVDVTSTSTPTAGQNGLITHKVEAQNMQHLQYGTSDAQTCTLTFWVRSNKTGTYCVQILQQDAPKYQLHEYSISSADTWEQKTITIVGNTADAINNDNGKGFDIRWHLACHSDDHVAASSTWTGSSEGYFATSNQVNLFDSTSNEWYLTGVQLEVGSVATPFEHRSYGDELAKCQRYFIALYKPRLRGVGSSSSNVNRCGLTLPTTMRGNPSCTASGTFDIYDGVGSLTLTSFSATYVTPDSVEFDGSLASGSTAAGRAITFYVGSTDYQLNIDAEL